MSPGGGDGGRGITRAQVALLALAAGAAVANLYYVQPLLPSIARAVGAAPREAGLVPVLTQLGYAAGMLIFVPLGDVVERRGLMLALFGAVSAALVWTGLAGSLPTLAAASFAVGLTTVVPQLAVPLAAHLARPDERGRVMGAVMSGLLVGILLARTAAGVAGEHLGWRAVYFLAAGFMLLIAAALRALFPASHPDAAIPWRALMGSMAHLARERELLEPAILGAGGMGAFSAFWSTLAFRLEAPPYHLGPQAAGLFGLVGVAGALAASWAGRLADRVPPRAVGGAFLALALASFGVFLAGSDQLWALCAGVVVLDLGVQGSHVANLARVHALSPAERSRRNTVYMVTYFAGGAVGTALGTWAWSVAGWPGVCASGAALVGGALATWAAGLRRARAVVEPPPA